MYYNLPKYDQTHCKHCTSLCLCISDTSSLLDPNYTNFHIPPPQYLYSVGSLLFRGNNGRNGLPKNCYFCYLTRMMTKMDRNLVLNRHLLHAFPALPLLRKHVHCHHKNRMKKNRCLLFRYKTDREPCLPDFVQYHPELATSVLFESNC